MGHVRPNPAPHEPPIAQADAPAGRFRGLVHDGVAVFRGLRYAAAPIGPLRFAPPVPAARIDGACDAFAAGPISIQDIDPLPLALPGTEDNYYAPGAVASEDCLNLNVWTPDLAGRAPVLVWIHGGAFLCGSGSGLWIDGTRHARDNGLVVVTINYRLGYLGGLFLGDYDARRSNLALQDQALALRWVKDNIAAFGGDPDRVTVGGHSAGAMSAAALVVAPQSRGLFRRAIIESGHLDAFIDVAAARETTRYILQRLGVDAGGDTLGALGRVSTFRLTALQRELGMSRRAFPLVGDDVTLPADPMAALAARPDVDILIGTTSEEDRLFAVTGWAPPALGLRPTLARFLRDGGARAEAEALYAPALAERGGDPVALTHLIATEHSWAEPARRLAAVHAAAGGRAYLYEFAWASSALDGRVGAAHLVDLPFLFDNLDAPGVGELLGEAGSAPPARRLAREFSAAAAAFARSGEPGDWPPFTPSNRATRVFAATSRVEIDRLAARLDFWERNRAHSAPALSTLSDA
ncbi:para-nitrobenzyl esterase [Roseiarcus fermentans]|uniref:Carboxylic ester hydrolase n=1 Tax=Roseiarcus fermentans TaxID=1473586 RepID=A0A366FKR7_9HYPH|nr:carboxylesterase family protein [Roseiarcus fermentans]RBP14315.1 para-nitrobenzyl esterase [Roseiarcus fermentans]